MGGLEEGRGDEGREGGREGAVKEKRANAEHLFLHQLNSRILQV